MKNFLLIVTLALTVNCSVVERHGGDRQAGDKHSLGRRAAVQAVGSPVPAKVCYRTKRSKSNTKCTQKSLHNLALSTISPSTATGAAQPAQNSRSPSSSVKNGVSTVASVTKSSSALNSPKFSASSSTIKPSMTSSALMQGSSRSSATSKPPSFSSLGTKSSSSMASIIVSPISVASSSIKPISSTKMGSSSLQASSVKASSMSSSKPSSTVSPSSNKVSSSASAITSASTKTSSSFITSTSAKTSSTVGGAMPSNYPSIALFYHNKHRANHSAVDLTWNAAQALTAAKIAASCVFQHQMNVDGGGYGQNLAAQGFSGNVAAMDPNVMVARSITRQWYYGEVNSFLPSYYGQANPSPGTFSKWGHFSQVVWKGTSSVGCASQYCNAGTIFAGFASWFTVCNYVEPGNWAGEYGTNIGPPLGQPAIDTP